MKTLKYTVLLMFFTTISYSCKKYSDGPLISFRSKLSRVAGTYKFVGFYVDGIDSLQRLNDSCDCELYFGDEKRHDYDRSYYFFQLTNNKSINPNTHLANFSYGEWNFVLGKEQIEISTGSSTGHVSLTGGVLYSQNPIDIIMLKEHEMTLKTNYNNKEYLWKLKKQ